METELDYAAVRRAGRFAWHPDGYLFADRRLFRAVTMEPPASSGYAGVLHVSPAQIREPERTLKKGWRHPQGCDCEFCKQTAAPLGTPTGKAGGSPGQ